MPRLWNSFNFDAMRADTSGSRRSAAERVWNTKSSGTSITTENLYLCDLSIMANVLNSYSGKQKKIEKRCGWFFQFWKWYEYYSWVCSLIELLNMGQSDLALYWQSTGLAGKKNPTVSFSYLTKRDTWWSIAFGTAYRYKVYSTIHKQIMELIEKGTPNRCYQVSSRCFQISPGSIKAYSLKENKRSNSLISWKKNSFIELFF